MVYRCHSCELSDLKSGILRFDPVTRSEEVIDEFMKLSILVVQIMGKNALQVVRQRFDASVQHLTTSVIERFFAREW